VQHTQTNGQEPTAGEMPVLVILNGIPFWQASGRTFPLVAGAEDPPPADEHNEDEEAEDEEFDKGRALATIRKQREREKATAAELKAARAEAAALKAKEQERADAERSELEKAQAKLAEREKAHDEAEAKLRRVLISQAIERAARKHNARNPEVVAKLIDQDALQFGEDGEPTNAEELVKALLKTEMYLVGTGNGTNGVPSTPRSNGNNLTHDQVLKQDQEELRLSGRYNPL
jgi:multidrug efflux pump subunit AcrA (membrane-fusion protein)